MKNISIIFMGTPEFAVPTLEALNSEFGVRAVVTVPDKPQGRGRQLMPSAVKIKALELGLPLLQPEILKDEAFIRQLSEFEPDIIAVLAFRILPAQVYGMAKIGAFNVHASLLPKYRGAAPINWTIINGEKETGLTSFLLREKVDTGDTLIKKKIQIPEGFTAGDLHDLMMPEAAAVAAETCRMLISGKYQPLPQDDTQATGAPKLFPEQCRIDWNKNAETVKNFIHGTSPIPGAWTEWNGARLKIFRAALIEKSNLSSGQFDISGDNFTVGCGSGSLSLLEIQPQNKKPLKVSDFLRGYRGDKNSFFV